MTLTQRQQEILMKISGEMKISVIIKDRSIDKGYGSFLLKTLVQLGLINMKFVGRAKVYSLTFKGKQLNDILKSLPNVSHVWDHVPIHEYIKKFKK